MAEHSNFTMTPNIVFDVLTNDYDLVGYQKLLRFVGIGNTWKGGNYALAEKLNMSYGRVVKLKKVLLDAGFIEITKGDNAHGESDGWKLVDIWTKNDAEATLSPNEHDLITKQISTLSPNEQGQTPENSEDVENIEDRPYHQTDNPLSPNEHTTLSPNEQHKEKISYKEILRNTEESKDSLVRLPANDAIREVFEYWQVRLGKENFTLTKDRRAKIKTRLKIFSVDQLKQAIDGTFKDDWLMGRAERSTKPYNDFETIFKNDSKVEILIELSKNGENNGIIQANNKPKFETANERRNTDAKRRIEFSNAARQILKSQGIIPNDSS